MKLRGYRRRAFICRIVGHVLMGWRGVVVCDRCGATALQIKRGER